VVGGRSQLLPQKSQSEKFVVDIYAFSILLLLVMAIAALYITDIVVTTVYGTFATLVVLLYKSSFFAIFLLALVIGYVQGKNPLSKERRRGVARLMHIVMLVFVIIAWFTFMVWNSFSAQPIEVAFFAFFSMTEAFVLEIHIMTYSVWS
jgi:hypothetical protein